MLGNWFLIDDLPRDWQQIPTSSENRNFLNPNTNTPQTTDIYDVQPLGNATGFQFYIMVIWDLNTSGNDYIYIAHAKRHETAAFESAQPKLFYCSINQDS